jgi:spermidine/putrescine transport system substrate-binding protein
MKRPFAKLLLATAIGMGLSAMVLPMTSVPARAAETLRLLTWGGYATDDVIKKFETEHPGIKVEVTLSNNEEMIAKLRATGGSGFDLAQPGFNRIRAAQAEFDIYKPLDLSKITSDRFDPIMFERVKASTTIDGKVYAVPHLWGSSGIMSDKTKAPGVKDWLDLCDAQYKGRVSMRLARTILVGSAFALGEDPYGAYSDLKKYQEVMDKVATRLIACKDNVKAYWRGGDDLAAMMLSGEAVASDTWDATAYKLYAQNKNIVYVPPKSGAIGWIDSFALPKRGRADDAAYKWINFVTRPEIAALMGAKTGAVTAVKGGIDLMPDDKKEAIKTAFTDADIANIKWAAVILPGVEDIEGKTLERIKAATAK